ncbi:hypothetical protein [Leptospira kmetyi]|nr:hypothetical protein [Leptospira kmetyi]
MIEKVQILPKHLEVYKEHIKKFPDTGLYLLSSFIPNRFDNYFEVPPIYGVKEDFPFEEYSIKPESFDKIQNNDSILRKKDFFRPFNENELTLYSVKDLPPYSSEYFQISDPDKLWLSKGIKILHEPTLMKYIYLLSLLKSSSNIFCYIIERIDRGNYNSILENDHLYSGLLTDIIMELDSNGFDLTAIIFDESNQWCFVTILDQDRYPFLAVTIEFLSKKLKPIQNELIQIEPDFHVFS